MRIVSRPDVKTKVAALALALGGLAVGSAAAAEPWPDLSMVRVSDGTALSTRAATSSGNWVVVIVKPACRPCQDIVRHLGAETSAGRQNAGHLFVVLSRLEDAESAAVRAGAPGIPAQAWLSDPGGAAAAALGVQAAPAIYGTRGGDITWVLRGSQFSAAFLRDQIVPWLR
jgi:hypothetical protein